MFALLAVTGATLLADQWSKRLADRLAATGTVTWGPVLRVRRVLHRKDFYAHGHARVALLLLFCVSMTCALVLYSFHPQFSNRAAAWGLGAALGGAAGNLTDILRRRGIVDFVDLRWWPVFNLADVAIVGGLALAFWPF